MSSINNYRGGVVNLIALPTHASANTTPAYAIEVGDLVGVSGSTALPAPNWANAATFKAAFAGVAVQKIGLMTSEKSYLPLAVTNPGWVLVATTGDFAFTCATGISWLPNSFVAVYVYGGACYRQQVALAANDSTAIGVAHLTLSDLGVTTLTEVIVTIHPQWRYEQVISGV